MNETNLKLTEYAGAGKFRTAAAVTTLFFLLVSISGFIPGVRWISVSNCFRHLGCNKGFFGFDGLEHVLSGIAETFIILTISQRGQGRAIFRYSFRGNALIFLSLIALIGLGWEIFEFFYDCMRLYPLHINLYLSDDFAQPSNSDTMGDLILNFVGPVVFLCISKLSGLKPWSNDERLDKI